MRRPVCLFVPLIVFAANIVATAQNTTNTARAVTAPTDTWSYACQDYDRDGYGHQHNCMFVTSNNSRVFSKSRVLRASREDTPFVRNNDDCNDYTPLLTTRCPSQAAEDIGYYQGLVYLIEAYPYNVTDRLLERYRDNYAQVYEPAILPQLAKDIEAVGFASERYRRAMARYEQLVADGGTTPSEERLIEFCERSPGACPIEMSRLTADEDRSYRRGVSRRIKKPFNEVTLTDFCLSTKGACRFPFGSDNPEAYLSEAVDALLKNGGVPGFLAAISVDPFESVDPLTLNGCTLGGGGGGIQSLIDKFDLAGSSGFLSSLPSGLTAGADSIVSSLNQMSQNALANDTYGSCSSDSGVSELSKFLDNPTLYSVGFGQDVHPSPYDPALIDPSLAGAAGKIEYHKRMAVEAAVKSSSGAVLSKFAGPISGPAWAMSFTSGWVAKSHDSMAKQATADHKQASSLFGLYLEQTSAKTSLNEAQNAAALAQAQYNVNCTGGSNSNSQRCIRLKANLDQAKAQADKKKQDLGE